MKFIQLWHFILIFSQVCVKIFFLPQSKRCIRGISLPIMTTLQWKTLKYVVQIKDIHFYDLLHRFLLCKSRTEGQKWMHHSLNPSYLNFCCYIYKKHDEYYHCLSISSVTKYGVWWCWMTLEIILDHKSCCHLLKSHNYREKQIIMIHQKQAMDTTVNWRIAS